MTRIGFTILRIPVHLLVDYVSEPTPGDFVLLFEEGMDYSKKAFSGGTGLKILSSSFAMVPCIACEDVHPDTIRYVTRRHLLWSYHLKYWWHGFDFFPVLFSLKTREIHYWRGNSLAGVAVYPLSRRLGRGDHRCSHGILISVCMVDDFVNSSVMYSIRLPSGGWEHSQSSKSFGGKGSARSFSERNANARAKFSGS